MIKSLEIINDRFPKKYKYMKDVFDIGSKFNFNEGINLLIGYNGSGKSSLLNLLRVYTHCKEIGRTKLTSDSVRFLLDSGNIFDSKDSSLLDAARISADYRISTFTNTEKAECNSFTGENVPQSFAYNSEIKGKSDGQSVISRFNIISGYMRDRNFHTPDISSLDGYCLEMFNSHIKSYWKENQFNDPNPRFSVILDEPERNLDIDNMLDLEKDLILSSKNTQIITSIHNPLLIYRLSKIKGVNFIEMSDGYLNKIKRTIEDEKI